LSAMRALPGFPARLNGTTKYDKRTLAIRNGDLAMDATGGDFKMVSGVHALGQHLEHEIHEVTDPNTVTLDEVPFRIEQALLQGRSVDYIDSVRDVRSDGTKVSIEFSAFGYEGAYIQKLRLGQGPGQFTLEEIAIAAPDPTAYVIRLKEFAEGLAEDIARGATGLNQIGWLDLERIVHAVLVRLEFDATLTPPAKDGGRDVIVRFNVDGVPMHYVIEIKHWPSGPVGQGVVTHFLQVVVRDRADAGFRPVRRPSGRPILV